ncbi:MAG: DegV family protein [Christensenellales bacterium]
MKDFVLYTDSACDLPASFLKEHQVSILNYPYITEPAIKLSDEGFEANSKVFYDHMRNGGNSTTSQINSETFLEAFTPHMQQGKDILLILLSSNLTGTIQNAMLARTELDEKFPINKLVIVDSLCASMGLGLLVYYAALKKESGMSIDELADWLNDHKLSICHWFTVDDLVYLKRGGRVSSTAAFFADVLDIKPLMHVDNEGRLIPVAKVRGRKKALRSMCNKFLENVIDPQNQLIMISHGDCMEDALQLKEMIVSQQPVKDVMINPIGPIVGSHSGPGTLALFFVGKTRD